MTNTKTNSRKQPNNTITHCTFTGVHWDAKAVESISLIAQGLIENAKALGSLAEVLKSSNVAIEAMVKMAPTAMDIGQ